MSIVHHRVSSQCFHEFRYYIENDWICVYVLDENRFNSNSDGRKKLTRRGICRAFQLKKISLKESQKTTKYQTIFFNSDEEDTILNFSVVSFWQWYTNNRSSCLKSPLKKFFDKQFCDNRLPLKVRNLFTTRIAVISYLYFAAMAIDSSSTAVAIQRRCTQYHLIHNPFFLNVHQTQKI